MFQMVPPFKPALAIAATYLLATAVMVEPIFNYTHPGSSVYPGDARLILWTLAWDNHAVLGGRPLFQANIFHPAPDSLAYNEHLFGLSLFTLPVTAATANPALAYNLLWWLSFPLNALAAHALAWRLTRDHAAAVAGGLLYAFGFYKMLHGHGHLSLIWVFWIPASLLILERWFREPTWLRFAALWSVVLLQVLTSWYLAVLILFADALLLLWLCGTSRLAASRGKAAFGARLARPVLQLFVGAAAGAAIVWPFASRYLTLASGGPDEASRFAASLSSYLMPPADTWLGVWLTDLGFTGLGSVYGERTLFVGWVGAGLAAVGIVGALRPGRAGAAGASLAGFFTLLLIASAWLSFGPSTGIGAPDWSGLAFDWFSRLPGMGLLRAPARFGLLVLLSVAMLAAAGARVVRLAAPRAGTLALAAAMPLLLGEFYLARFPGGKPQPEEIPPVYRLLATLEPGAVVSLPTFRSRPDEWWRAADYLYYSTAHWKPIVNGFGRTEPDDYFWIIGHMDAFPGPRSAETMRRLGIRYVVLHAARYPDAAAAILTEAEESDDFQRVARFGDDHLFRVAP